ncbi:RNA polymerase sigma factor [Acinetobacter boissieri]|uniref:RNA polymerase sigma-70 factor, ECF subfamily n=1 Tax=Acinetobacter boissieri TaxID=1219383 RepID=A0A1G6GST2_9GAMM|nr:RNA polymerase sigma factor [Acinetobacter boissieri]SDB85004.1 RNA polymerase sigma-70 factor, ECF subfamily [Acinetobacter boissieri]
MDLVPPNTQADLRHVSAKSSEQRLSAFMHEVSGRALIMMESATKNTDIAMDLVQEAFISLYKAYSKKPTEEWYALFYTILNNKLYDWKRKEQRSAIPFSLFKKKNLDFEDDAPEEQIADDYHIDPAEILSQHMTINEIKEAIDKLPIRQQQAFMLRAWEGFSTKTTAEIMQCSEGSVKTHYYRATQALQQMLSYLSPYHQNKGMTDE